MFALPALVAAAVLAAPAWTVANTVATGRTNAVSLSKSSNASGGRTPDTRIS